MSKVIKLKRGLDIRLVGEAEKTVVQMPVGSTYAVIPDSFPRITPKLLVSEGARVKAGTPLFFDKARPQILFTSPVSGTVSAIRRGEKRRILAVVIDADPVVEYSRLPFRPSPLRRKSPRCCCRAGFGPSSSKGLTERSPIRATNRKRSLFRDSIPPPWLRT